MRKTDAVELSQQDAMLRDRIVTWKVEGIKTQLTGAITYVTQTTIDPAWYPADSPRREVEQKMLSYLG